MDRRGFILELLKVRPRNAGQIAFYCGGTVAQAQADLELMRDDPEGPLLGRVADSWRFVAEKKPPSPPEPKRPVRRPKHSNNAV